jgi:hypothetical protein
MPLPELLTWLKNYQKTPLWQRHRNWLSLPSGATGSDSCCRGYC